MKKWSWNIWKELKRICQPQEKENSVPDTESANVPTSGWVNSLDEEPKGSSPWSSPITFIRPWRTPRWQDLLGTIVDMLLTESTCEKGGTQLSWETDLRPLRQIQRAEAEEQERKWRWVGPLAGCLLMTGSGACAVDQRPQAGREKHLFYCSAVAIWILNNVCLTISLCTQAHKSCSPKSTRQCQGLLIPEPATSRVQRNAGKSRLRFKEMEFFFLLGNSLAKDLFSLLH